MFLVQHFGSFSLNQYYIMSLWVGDGGDDYGGDGGGGDGGDDDVGDGVDGDGGDDRGVDGDGCDCGGGNGGHGDDYDAWAAIKWLTIAYFMEYSYSCYVIRISLGAVAVFQ